jgi:hypothetical protein
MVIFNSKFSQVNYLELQYLLHFYWTDYAGYMDSEGVYHEFLNFLSHRIYKRANQIYIDWRKIEHLISQETIDWFLQYILPKIVSHTPYRMGFLLTDTNKVQLMKIIEINNRKIEADIFNDSEKLMQWLMEGAERKEPGSDDHHDHDSCHTH